MLAAGLLAASIAAACLATLMRHGQQGAVSAGRDVPFADIPLLDQDETRRTLSRWSDRLVVLDFIYTGCGDTCPIKTGQLADVQQNLDPVLRDRVQFVSVSIDPEHDSPAALKAYAARNGAELSDWAFLTGDLARIARFAAAFDAAPETGADGADVSTHITTIRLLDGSFRVLQRYVGEPVDQLRLLRDIHAAASLPAWKASARPE